MDKPAMRFLFGDRELLLTIGDLLASPVDVIVNPADSALQHLGGLSRQLVQQAGEQLQRDSEQIIREYGQIDTGMAVYTSAGKLPYQAVIHAVGPVMGEGEEQRKLERAVSRSLQLCEMNEWRSIAFPAISTGNLQVPVEVCARAFYRAITRFWDARHDCVVEKVMVCLTERRFQAFFNAFREHGLAGPEASQLPDKPDSDEAVGHIELSEDEIADLDDSDINKWFK
jgi:O-acetyl-ADP-ribose deacetylase (regulator of RNase III)